MIDLARLPRNLILWSMICVVSAAPSFIWSQRDYNSKDEQAGIVLGVALFIILYTLVTSSSWFIAFSRHRAIRTTLKIGYGTRLTISLYFPVGMALDLFFGMCAVEIAREMLGRGRGGVFTFVATVIQGGLLNAALLAYMAVLLPIVNAFSRPTTKDLVCESCGYDLRASADRCPECGTSIPSDIAQNKAHGMSAVGPSSSMR